MTGNVRFNLWKRMHLNAPTVEYPLWIGQQLRAAADQPESGVITFGETPYSTYNPPHVINHDAFNAWLIANATHYRSAA